MITFFFASWVIYTIICKIASLEADCDKWALPCIYFLTNGITRLATLFAIVGACLVYKKLKNIILPDDIFNKYIVLIISMILFNNNLFDYEIKLISKN